MRRAVRAGLEPVPLSREEVRRKSTSFTLAAIACMVAGSLSSSYSPTTSFFHDFSGTDFSGVDTELLGFGINFGLSPRYRLRDSHDNLLLTDTATPPPTPADSSSSAEEECGDGVDESSGGVFLQDARVCSLERWNESRPW